ncbi:AlpA family phage regulatory protein [Rhodoferax sp. GW822-FHT02A01]|uniref:helix-turn-helix transcriptional regulator n=1 Tax=Rhodoferax sp. GW822-FHT02A01 TaxID=3141537 RepID=UPI00315CF514
MTSNTPEAQISANAAGNPAVQAKTAHRAPPNFDDLPDSALLRESQLVPSPKRPGVPALLPISGPTLWRMVKAGEFPAPIKLTGRITAWRAGQVREWLQSRVSA